MAVAPCARERELIKNLRNNYRTGIMRLSLYKARAKLQARGDAGAFTCADLIIIS